MCVIYLTQRIFFELYVNILKLGYFIQNSGGSKVSAHVRNVKSLFLKAWKKASTRVYRCQQINLLGEPFEQKLFAIMKNVSRISRIQSWCHFFLFNVSWTKVIAMFCHEIFDRGLFWQAVLIIICFFRPIFMFTSNEQYLGTLTSLCFLIEFFNFNLVSLGKNSIQPSYVRLDFFVYSCIGIGGSIAS